MYRNAFRKWTDWVHFVLGASAGLLLALNGLLSLAIILVYLAYQSVERESRFESYCDIVEFLAGYAAGLSLTRI